MLAIGLAAATGASAYYHFVRFPSRVGPPVAERFDINALPGKTVLFHISEQGPTLVAPNDSFASAVSQIRLAANAWNEVATSDLRVAFGGLYTPGTPQSAPGIDVIFDEVPPGLLALGGPTSRAELTLGPNGAFIPITRSVVILRRDLTQRPSFTESFFLSVVHEFGHALGLQHTMTSSVMSTELTRATSKSRPLAADDVAGLSLLYPTRAFQTTTGSIAGRVLVEGEGVHLGSVVALSPTGGAVSALTNPDGTYRIEGLAPGQYFVYAHPLPPPQSAEVTPANIVLPLDADNRPIPAGPGFDTQFYPGVKDHRQAFPVTVSAGNTVEGVQFSAQRRAGPVIHSVQTFGFPGAVPVKPPHILRGGPRSFLVASGPGLSVNNAPAPGLSASVLGGLETFPQEALRSYAPAPAWVQLDVAFQNPLAAPEGPRHLVFSLNGDIHVVPSAYRVVPAAPPSLSAATPALDAQGNRTVAISGANLSSATQVLFDGRPATIRSVEEPGRLIVTPPAAPAGHRAAVVALNADGQSSLFLSATPLVYEYDFIEAGTVFASASPLQPGTETVIEIQGTNTNFLDGQTVVGFGTSDVALRRLWVTGPNRALANVWVAPSAQPGWTLFSVVTGLRTILQPFGVQVAAPNPRQMALGSPVSGTPGRGLSAGSIAVMSVSNLPAGATPATVVVTLNDRPVPVVSAGSGQVSFQIPAGTPTGPAVVRLQAAGEQALPLAMAIDVAPPVIAAATAGGVLAIDASRPARPGEVLALFVSGLADPNASPNLAAIRILVGTVEHIPSLMFAFPQGGLHSVQFVLSPSVSEGTQVPVVLSLDGRTSPPYLMPIRK